MSEQEYTGPTRPVNATSAGNVVVDEVPCAECFASNGSHVRQCSRWGTAVCAYCGERWALSEQHRCWQMGPAPVEDLWPAGLGETIRAARPQRQFYELSSTPLRHTTNVLQASWIEPATRTNFELVRNELDELRKRVDALERAALLNKEGELE